MCVKVIIFKNSSGTVRTKNEAKSPWQSISSRFYRLDVCVILKSLMYVFVLLQQKTHGNQ